MSGLIKGRNLFIILAVSTAFFIPVLAILTVQSEFVPVRIAHQYGNFSDMFVRISYPSPLIVPFRNWIWDYDTSVTALIRNFSNVRISNVELVAPQQKADLSFDEFLLHSRNPIEYSLPIKARNNGNVTNETGTYLVNIIYTNGSNKVLQHRIPFEWNIMTTDMSSFGYFWIIMAGIVVSRFITFVVVRKKNKKLEIDRGEALWLLYSFVIGVVAFYYFRDTVSNSESVLINISEAFGFGLVSQKVLELAKNFEADV